MGASSLRWVCPSSTTSLVSTRLWLELYRQEITFLDSGRSGVNRQLEERVGCIRADIADGQLNEAEDWHDWLDMFIFREKQRAIGEAMIQNVGAARMVLGFGAFSELIEPVADRRGTEWLMVAARFLGTFDASGRPDFRQVRLQRLVVDLVDLIELLDRRRATREMIEWRRRWSAELARHSRSRGQTAPAVPGTSAG